MVEVVRTFTVATSKGAVATYLRDFANAVIWDPGTQSCTQITPGPIAVGTQWTNVSKLYGITTELTYTLEVDEPGHVVLRGENKTATSVDDITLTDTGPGLTELTYRAHIEFKGIARIVDGLAGLAFERVGNEVVKNLTAALKDLT